MSIGANIKRLRDSTNMKSVDLAKAVNVTAAAVTHWENGDALPNADKLPKIAAALGCKIEDLFAKDGEEVEG